MEDAAEEHPLQTSWSIWEHHKGGVSDFGTNMNKIGDFSTVEGFWRFFNHIPPPSQMFTTEDGGGRQQRAGGAAGDREIEGISLFRKGIRPEWEDLRNMHGAEFFLKKNLNMAQLDQWWENLIMSAVGETIDPADVLCGVRVVDKSSKGKVMYRVEIWFSCTDKSDSVMVEKIRNNVINAMQTTVKLDYKEHSAAISQGFAPTQHGGGRR
jgi:translation initiation factor 4E